MRFSVYHGFALAALCTAIYFLVGRHSKETEIIAMSTASMLTDDELRRLPKDALGGNCKAAVRLGDFYMTQMANPREAEKWYRTANSCANDPRIKEFLINCIVLNSKDDASIKDTIRLFQEMEALDPERAQRMRESTERYVGHKIPKH